MRFATWFRRSSEPRGDARSLRAFRLVVALVVVVVVSGSDWNADSQALVGGTDMLAATGPLTLVAARQAATTTVDEIYSASEAQLLASTAVEHVESLARHQILNDRPHHPAIRINLGSGQTPEQLGRQWRLQVEDLTRLNPDLNFDDLSSGASLVVWQWEADNAARSRGRANRGSLLNGEPMPDGPGWVISDPESSWAAAQTIDGLVQGMRVVMGEHPGGQELLVADISRRRGGRMRPHRSHQSGRDVDITYYRLTTDPPTFDRTPVDQLDAVRNWTFLRTLLTHHEITYIFISSRLQPALYEAARAAGDHPAFVAESFQRGTDGHNNSYGVIRHASGHYDHMHIRFSCSDADVSCRD